MLDGYNQFVNPSYIDNSSRCTILYIKSEIDAELYVKLNDKSSKETVWCDIKLPTKEKLLIGLVYRSPNSSGVNDMALNNLINALKDETHTYITLMGDFNYREIDWNH